METLKKTILAASSPISSKPADPESSNLFGKT